MSDSTATKSNVFVEELALADGGSGSVETGTRKTSTGGEVTLTKLDQGHIKFRAQAGTAEDLVDGGQDIDIYPKNIDAGGTGNIDGTLRVGGVTTLAAMNSAGFVKNSAAGVLSGGNALGITAGDLPSAIDAAKIANGSVSNTEFQFLDGASSNIQTQINNIVSGAAIQAPFALLQNRQAQNVSGGTATAGAWNIVPLNTEQEDVDNFVTVSALPAFSLAAGTYRFEAFVPIYKCGNGQIRLYNVTDGAVSIIGCSVINATENLTTILYLIGTVIISGTKQFRLEYYIANTNATYGHGVAANYGVEVYAQLKIEKIA